jgi:cation transport ATPase
LPWLISLALQTVHTIRWNLVWALAYNVLGIALAAAGCLHPIMAALAMGASSLLVVANSLRLANHPLAFSPSLPLAASPIPAGATT